MNRTSHTTTFGPAHELGVWTLPPGSKTGSRRYFHQSGAPYSLYPLNDEQYETLIMADPQAPNLTQEEADNLARRQSTEIYEMINNAPSDQRMTLPQRLRR